MKKVSITFRRSLLLLLISLVLWPAAFAQSVITGTVIDNFGDPVLGASVVEKGTTNGVITDIDGNFSLKMQNDKNKIEVSYVGMATQSLVATPGKAMKVQMEENNAMLDDVVVVGYTSKARKDLTGSVGSISGSKLEVVPAASAAEALQGKIAGVQVTSVDGQPGAEINIRIRGGSSVTQSNEPLYIVDGFQVSNINDIPPTDIQSIDVLKDASLTAIYGAKGSNGVVVVTTKSASVGKVKVTINAKASISMLSKKLDLMDAADFARYQYQWHACDGTRSSRAKFFKANFGNPYDLDMYSTLPSHDWQDEVMGEKPINYETNATVGGGSDKVNFNLSITQREDKGIILGSGVRRTNIDMKTNVNVTDKFKILLNNKFSFRRDEGAGGENVGTGGIIDVLKYRPTNGLREFGYIDPAYADPLEEGIFTYTNPKNDIKINQLRKHAYNYRTGISLTWLPVKGLSLKSDATIGIKWNDQSRFWGSMTSTGKNNDNKPVAQLQNGFSLSYVWTNVANYNLDLNDHNFNFVLGQEIQHSQSKSNTMQNRYFPEAFTAEMAWNNMGFGTASPNYPVSSLGTPDRMASFFTQVTYNYAHKYLAGVTFRADGSTKFAKDNRWGIFPAVSGAWVVSEEDFMNDISWLDQLKVRASIGITGNNSVAADSYRKLYSINGNGGPSFGESAYLGDKYYGASGGNTYYNPHIQWESKTSRNLAFDISLFKGRLNITPEFYWDTTIDQIHSSNILPVSGFSKQEQNIGQLTNRGFELAVNGDIIQGKDYVLSANFSLGMNKKVVDKLNGVTKERWEKNGRWSSDYYDYCLREGSEVGLIYGFVYDGLYGFDEFYFDPLDNYRAVPYGSSAADNGTSKNIDPREDGYVTVINDVLPSSNSGIATMPGKPKFKDLDGDGRITENDRTVIGNPNPKVQGGFGLSGQYKNWDFSANFVYMLDFDVNNATAYTLSSSISNSNNFYNVLSKFNNGWLYNDIDGSLTETKGDILYRLYYVDNGVDIYKNANKNRTLWNPTDVTKRITQSYFIEDGSFLRCNDITIGYTLPKNISKKAGVSKARFYVQTSNLFVITGYSGYDPEVAIQEGLTPGMDYNRYPRNRSFIVGTNITF